MTNNQITDHFTLSELLYSETANRHQVVNCFPVDKEKIYRTRAANICQFLETVRAALRRPIYINSGYRTKRVNALVGGVPNSRHRFMCAVDITFSEFDRYWPGAVKVLRNFNPRFIKVYHDRKFIHVDWPESFLDTYLPF